MAVFDVLILLFVFPAGLKKNSSVANEPSVTPELPGVTSDEYHELIISAVSMLLYFVESNCAAPKSHTSALPFPTRAGVSVFSGSLDTLIP